MKRKLMVKALIACGTLLPIIVLGQNLVNNSNAQKGTGSCEGAIIVKNESQQPGVTCFELSTPGMACTNNLIPVDMAKNYKLSGSFKTPALASLDDVYFSLIPFDSEKKQIQSFEVNFFPGTGTETVLTAPCNAEDTILQIKDGSKWQKNENGCIAFESDDSGMLQDLPNRNISSGFGIKSVDNKGDHWEVSLVNKCGKNYPVGTKVREHAASNTYIYPVIIQNLSQDSGWKKVEGLVNGTEKSGVATNQFWPKTAFIKVSIFVFSGKPSKLLFDDIKFEEVK